MVFAFAGDSTTTIFMSLFYINRSAKSFHIVRTTFNEATRGYRGDALHAPPIQAREEARRPPRLSIDIGAPVRHPRRVSVRGFRGSYSPRPHRHLVLLHRLPATAPATF